MIKFSIVITTKNRLEDLKYTLSSLKPLIARDDVELLLCDDASTDGTSEYLTSNFLENTIFNTNSKGLMYNRNMLYSISTGEYIISLDDDLNFLSENPLELIEDFFKNNIKCGVLTFSIYWDLNEPINYQIHEKCTRVNSYAGGAHVFKKSVWNKLPKYPIWFKFYGEEDYISFYLFMKGYEICYFPKILTHHRVNLKNRKDDKDYLLRATRSLSSGWYLYFLFYPLSKIPKSFLYSVWMQIKLKIFKGHYKFIIVILYSVFKLILNFPRIIINRKPLSKPQFYQYKRLSLVPLFWSPRK